MPIYEYKCEECGLRFEVRQGFDDEPVTECPHEGCHGAVHRVFSPPTIIFKGSGFYVNDYGRGNKKKSSGPESGSENSSRPSEAAKTGSD